MKLKTKVEKYGAFWCVFVYRYGEWQRMRDLFCTREDARKACPYWAHL